LTQVQPSEHVANAPEEIGTVNSQSPAEQAEARRYGRIHLALTLLDMAVDFIYLGLMAFVFGPRIDAWLATFLGRGEAQSFERLVALIVVVTVLHFLVSLPLSFYSGYIVEHQFGLSNQSVKRWVIHWIKRIALVILIILGMYSSLFACIWDAGDYWWVYAAAVFFIFGMLSAQLGPLVLAMFYKVEPLENADLLERMKRLAAGTGLTIEGVYRLGLSADTTKANAMLAGLGRTRRVLMGDTLLDKFSPEEIEVIFAHEIGHHVHRHIPKMIATGVVVSLAAFYLLDRILIAWANIPSAANTPTSALPLVMFALTTFMLLLSPLQNAISRHYEVQCDTYALKRTNNPSAYRTAFTKLAKLNKADMNPNPIEVFLLHSHPPIAKRLALTD
jgi:STE24 endopeptidase